MAMKLFENLHPSKTHPRPVAIVTPLGAVGSSVVVNGERATLEEDGHFYSLAAGGFAACWKTQFGIAEVVVARPPHLQLFGQQITDCWAFVWRFMVLRKVETLGFESSWAADYGWTEGDGLEPGQYLDAQSWYDDKSKVSIGTADNECLWHCSNDTNGLPRRYSCEETNPTRYLNIVQYTDSGFCLNFGEAFPNEMFQVHFQVAWSPYSKEALGTWFALSSDPREIVNSVAKDLG